MFRIILLFLIHTSSFAESEKLIVWNVGQGQWVTISNDKFCSHFDVGGEFKPSSKKLIEVCGRKENRIYFSHWDWDHIGLIKYLSGLFPRTCIAQFPGGEGSESKVRLLKSFKTCGGDFQKNIQTLGATNSKTANAYSNVFVAQERVLIPGDSPTSQEKIWIHRLRWPLKIQTLILGHHGSRTSTSPELLGFLPHLRLAIASARGPRYGHPHLQTILRLQKQGIPMLRTEDWGHIFLPLPDLKNR